MSLEDRADYFVEHLFDVKYRFDWQKICEDMISKFNLDKKTASKYIADNIDKYILHN